MQIASFVLPLNFFSSRFFRAGSWKPEKGCKLETKASSYPMWAGTVVLHSGTTLEYKYTILRAGEVIWENGPVNRSIKTGTEMIVVNDGWFNGIRVDVQTAPLPAQDALAAVNNGQVKLIDI
jgi:hypothetical protein